MILLMTCILSNIQLISSNRQALATGIFFAVTVFIGYPGDSFDFVTKRLETVKVHGFYPMAMLYRRTKYRDFKGDTISEWRKFQRSWASHAAI